MKRSVSFCLVLVSSYNVNKYFVFQSLKMKLLLE